MATAKPAWILAEQYGHKVLKTASMLWGLIVADPSKTKAGPAKPVVAVDRDGVKLTVDSDGVKEVTFMICALAWVIVQVVDKMAWPLAYIVGCVAVTAIVVLVLWMVWCWSLKASARNQLLDEEHRSRADAEQRRNEERVLAGSLHDLSANFRHGASPYDAETEAVENTFGLLASSVAEHRPTKKRASSATCGNA